MANQTAAQYNQQYVHARTQPIANGTTATNIYNPPRPPEVYTLPNSVNDTLYEDIRQTFQHDSAGRVLFFAGPPLNRPVKRVSPQDEGVGHSVKYLAGRIEWLADRQKKRRWRKMSKATSSSLASHDSGSIEHATQAAATSALNGWLQAFDEGAVRWQQKAGLEG